MSRPIPGNGEPRQYYGLILAKPKAVNSIPSNHHKKCKLPWRLFRSIPNGSVFRCECGKVFKHSFDVWYPVFNDDWLKAGGSIK